MERIKILTILMLALLLTNISMAASMGTAFTYQGHLYDNNTVANGLYDFQFKLYDAVSDGNQTGANVIKPDVDVIDGYFTAELDFNDANLFEGNARWLEIGVRAGNLNDPNTYTSLSPRQRIVPTPYAMYSRNADTVDSYDASAFATAAHGHDSRYYTEGESDSRFVKLTGDRMEGESSSELLGVTNNALHGAIGVKGVATSTYPSTINYGRYFAAYGGNGRGVYGESSGNGGSGLYGKGTGGGTRGVIGEATGVQGKGVYGFASGTDGFGVYGNASGSNGIGVEGLATNNGSVTNYGGYFKTWGESGTGAYGEAVGIQGNGVYGKATGSNGVGIYGEATGGGKAGFFQGDLHVTGNMTKAYTSGTSNRASPIAYAYINTAGTVVAGTPNVSASWNDTSRRYEITIAGESYYDGGYITIVTLSNFNHLSFCTSSLNGKLVIGFYNMVADQYMTTAFQFVTYKP